MTASILQTPLDVRRPGTAAPRVNGCWIDGRSVRGSAQGCQDVLDPAFGTLVARVPAAGRAEVEAAVAAARRALPEWARSTPAERAAVLERLAVWLEGRTAQLARVEARQTGKTLRMAAESDLPGVVDNARFFAGAARILEGRAAGEYSGEHTSFVRREPVGVVAGILPWNYPLPMAAWKMLPALAAGNTVVLKPSELTPLTALVLAEAMSDMGLPPGVLNVVTGDGRAVGHLLATHPWVDMVSFTGSCVTGRAVMAAAASAGTRVHLELGGKCPFVVFEDADLEAAVHGAVAASLVNGGQDCTAAALAVVHASLMDDFLDGVADLMATVRLGDPWDPRTDQGPLISRQHRDRVAGFVERARQDGARVVSGGRAPGGDLERGAYYQPTLVTGVGPEAEIAREEVFGPVLVALPFTAEDEALALANGTSYGLAASVWTRDVFRSQRATREIRAGCVWVNDHIPIVSEMPHGGTKASGFGKDMSIYALEEYTVIKHVMSELTGAVSKPWHRTVFSGR